MNQAHATNHFDLDIYQDIDPSSPEVPAYVEGSIQNFTQTGASNLVLAIAINGVIHQTSSTTEKATSKLTTADIRYATGTLPATAEVDRPPIDGNLHFLARIPPGAFTKGANTVTVHGILEDDSGMPSSLINFAQQ